jgi:hypothetical protein
MFRVITKNSVYRVKPVNGGFYVDRLASTYGQPVKARHLHFTPTLEITVGQPMVTSVLHTTAILGILPA